MKRKVYQCETDTYIEMEVLARYKYIGETDTLGCVNGKIYDCVGIEEDGSLRIVDETEEDYLYTENKISTTP